MGQSLPGYSAFTPLLGGGDKRGGELLVEGEEVFDAVAVAGEGLGPVTAVHGAAPYGRPVE